MLVFCDGMPRSASTWSYNVVIKLLKARFPADPLYYGSGSQPVETLKALDPGIRHVVLKTHALTPFSMSLVRIGAAKAVYTHRDLADAVASGLRVSRQGFKSVVDVFVRGIDLYAFHRESGIGLMLPFEEVVKNQSRAVARIAGYLFEEKTSAKLIRQVARETSFTSMREKVEEINAGKLKLIKSGRNAYDPETLLYRNHVGEAQVGNGRTLLTDRQVARVDALIARHGLPR